MSYEKNIPHLDELFAPPVGLKVVAKLDGQELFGSEKLKLAFVEAISKSGRAKGSANKIKSLVKKRKIVPCFFEKSIRQFIMRKIFSPKSSRTVVAIFDPAKTKKIYVLMDNNVNFFTYAANSRLALYTIHELIHMFADKKPASFLNRFKPELISYYKTVWKTIFSLDEKKINDKEIEKIIKFLFRKIELNPKQVSNSDLTQYYKLLDSAFSEVTTLQKEQFIKRLRTYIVAIKIFIINFRVFYKSISKFMSVIGPLYSGYKQAFNIKNINVLCVQELIYPSEVISICSEHGFESKVNKSIKEI